MFATLLTQVDVSIAYCSATMSRLDAAPDTRLSRCSYCNQRPKYLSEGLAAINNILQDSKPVWPPGFIHKSVSHGTARICGHRWCLATVACARALPKCPPFHWVMMVYPNSLLSCRRVVRRHRSHHLSARDPHGLSSIDL